MDKIICVGKNYAEHVKELGDVNVDKPVIFLKPPSVLRQAKQGENLSVSIPTHQGSVHHECEIVIQLKSGGFRMTEMEAERCIGAVSVGLDMTLRDKQAALKKTGGPWTIAKVFQDSAIVGPWVSLEEFPQFSDAVFSLRVNGELRQEGKAAEMTFSPPKCIAYISEHFPLFPGDIVFTGTPKGVNSVLPRDTGVLTFGPIQFSLQWHELKS
ncbi:MAG: FAA hydrolase family protein [Bdellovibrionales bacterium]|nr:FAA hydrolase family protein [Bdellovibrionales bacterium]